MTSRGMEYGATNPRPYFLTPRSESFFLLDFKHDATNNITERMTLPRGMADDAANLKPYSPIPFPKVVSSWISNAPLQTT